MAPPSQTSWNPAFVYNEDTSQDETMPHDLSAAPSALYSTFGSENQRGADNMQAQIGMLANRVHGPRSDQTGTFFQQYQPLSQAGIESNPLPLGSYTSPSSYYSGSVPTHSQFDFAFPPYAGTHDTASQGYQRNALGHDSPKPVPVEELSNEVAVSHMRGYDEIPDLTADPNDLGGIDLFAGTSNIPNTGLCLGAGQDTGEYVDHATTGYLVPNVTNAGLSTGIHGTGFFHTYYPTEPTREQEPIDSDPKPSPINTEATKGRKRKRGASSRPGTHPRASVNVGAPSLACPQCSPAGSVTFSTPKQHDTHMRGTHGKFSCPLNRLAGGCGKTFGNKYEWKRHFYKQHIVNKVYTCCEEDCRNKHPHSKHPHKFARKDLFRTHYVNHHFSKEIKVEYKEKRKTSATSGAASHGGSSDLFGGLPCSEECRTACEKMERIAEMVGSERVRLPTNIACSASACAVSSSLDDFLNHLADEIKNSATGVTDHGFSAAILPYLEGIGTVIFDGSDEFGSFVCNVAKDVPTTSINPAYAPHAPPGESTIPADHSDDVFGTGQEFASAF